MCIPVAPQVTCRHREKEAVPYLPISQGTHMCLRPERSKVKSKSCSAWCRQRTWTLLSHEPGEHAGSPSTLSPISKLLQLFHVGWRVKSPEIKALSDIPAGRAHAWQERGLAWSPLSELSKPRMCVPRLAQLHETQLQGQLPHLPVKNIQSSSVHLKPLSLRNTTPYTHTSPTKSDEVKK